MDHDRVYVGIRPQPRQLPDDEGKYTPASEASRQGEGEEGERAQAVKATRILEACNNNDVPTLIAKATSPHGLMDDGIRRLACTS